MRKQLWLLWEKLLDTTHEDRIPYGQNDNLKHPTSYEIWQSDGSREILTPYYSMCLINLKPEHLRRSKLPVIDISYDL